MPRKKKKAEETQQQQQQRPVSLETLKYFWDTMANYFPELRINLCLFNYKAEGDKRPLVKHDVRENVPVAQAYEAVRRFLSKYHKGEDILWKPANSMTETSMLWVDDFRFDNELGLKPLLCIQTSPANEDENKPAKYQAFFKLTKAVPVEEAAELQKILVRLVGDKAASSYNQPRRMPGLSNGKYSDDPLVLMLKGEEGDGIIDPDQLKLIAQDNLKPARARGGVAEKTGEGRPEGRSEGHPEEQPQGRPEGRPERQPEGQPKGQVRGLYIKPVVPINYEMVAIKPRKAFTKRRPDGTTDDSATDMAWATHIARMTSEAGWDDLAIGFTIYDLLVKNSPEIKRRKRTPEHVRDYLYRTIWKALKKVKETPPEPPLAKAPDF